MRTVIYNREDAYSTQHIRGVFFRCSRCLQIKPVQRDGGTGYGYNREGLIQCYACCGQIDREAMIKTGRATLYLVKDRVTNWPDTLSFRVQRSVSLNHPFSKRAVMVYFIGPGGTAWSGKNIGDNDVLHCRRLGFVS